MYSYDERIKAVNSYSESRKSPIVSGISEQIQYDTCIPFYYVINFLHHLNVQFYQINGRSKTKNYWTTGNRRFYT